MQSIYTHREYPVSNIIASNPLYIYGLTYRYILVHKQKIYAYIHVYKINKHIERETSIKLNARLTSYLCVDEFTGQILERFQCQNIGSHRDCIAYTAKLEEKCHLWPLHNDVGEAFANTTLTSTPSDLFLYNNQCFCVCCCFRPMALVLLLLLMTFAIMLPISLFRLAKRLLSCAYYCWRITEALQWSAQSVLCCRQQFQETVV